MIIMIYMIVLQLQEFVSDHMYDTNVKNMEE